MRRKHHPSYPSLFSFCNVCACVNFAKALSSTWNRITIFVTVSISIRTLFEPGVVCAADSTSCRVGYMFTWQQEISVFFIDFAQWLTQRSGVTVKIHCSFFFNSSETYCIVSLHGRSVLSMQLTNEELRRQLEDSHLSSRHMLLFNVN